MKRIQYSRKWLEQQDKLTLITVIENHQYWLEQYEKEASNEDS